MSKRVKINAQYCAKKQGLATRSCRWLAACKLLEVEHVPSTPEVEASCQLEHYRTKSTVWPFSYLAAGTCDWIKPRFQSPTSSVLKNLTLHIPFSLHYKWPLYPRNVERFRREYWEINLREKHDWLIHNLHIEPLQIPRLSSSPLLNSWEVHYQNFFSPYSYL